MDKIKIGKEAIVLDEDEKIKLRNHLNALQRYMNGTPQMPDCSTSLSFIQYMLENL